MRISIKRSFSIELVVRFLLLCLLSACPAACGDDTDGSSGGACVPNQSSACTCNDGNEGVKTCGEDGAWGGCAGCADGGGVGHGADPVASDGR